MSGRRGPTKGLLEKDPAPPPPEIQNYITPPSATGYPIEAGVFNASNRAGSIDLVRNQVLEVNDNIELSNDNVSLVHTPAADTLFEGQTWGWYEIDRRSVAEQSQNEPSFKNGWIPQILSYICIFLNFLPIKG